METKQIKQMKQELLKDYEKALEELGKQAYRIAPYILYHEDYPDDMEDFIELFKEKTEFEELKREMLGEE